MAEGLCRRDGMKFFPMKIENACTLATTIFRRIEEETSHRPAEARLYNAVTTSRVVKDCIHCSAMEFGLTPDNIRIAQDGLPLFGPHGFSDEQREHYATFLAMHLSDR